MTNEEIDSLKPGMEIVINNHGTRSKLVEPRAIFLGKTRRGYWRLKIEGNQQVISCDNRNFLLIRCKLSNKEKQNE